jgi:sec-independent protein translocase protein TatA
MSLGPTELLLLLGIALLFFGPSRLPDLGKSFGEAIRGFKKGMEDEEKPAPKEQIVASETQTSTAAEKEKHKVD